MLCLVPYVKAFHLDYNKCILNIIVFQTKQIIYSCHLELRRIVMDSFSVLCDIL